MHFIIPQQQYDTVHINNNFLFFLLSKHYLFLESVLTNSLEQNINQTLNSQQTPHLPPCVSYWVSIVRIDCDIMVLYCLSWNMVLQQRWYDFSLWFTSLKCTVDISWWAGMITWLTWNLMSEKRLSNWMTHSLPQTDVVGVAMFYCDHF